MKERFEKYVMPIPWSGCHEWIGSLNKQTGYGQFRLKKTMAQTHRVSYELYRGEIPKGLWVLHKCDNRSCVNPEHLFLGTQSDNTQDMLSKGRHNPKKKLSEEEVIQIRNSSEKGIQLAQKFNVSPAQISKIRTGKQRKYNG